MPYPPKSCLQGFFGHTLSGPLSHTLVGTDGFEPTQATLKGWGATVTQCSHKKHMWRGGHICLCPRPTLPASGSHTQLSVLCSSIQLSSTSWAVAHAHPTNTIPHSAYNVKHGVQDSNPNRTALETVVIPLY